MPLKVAFFDFDKTLAVGSVGDYFLGKCGPTCLNYTVQGNPPFPCPCTDNLTAFGDFFTNNYVNGSNNEALNGSLNLIFNGTDRRDRLLQTFKLLESKGVMIRILSTAWVSVNASMWTYFLDRVCFAGGLGQYLNSSTILALDDPGQGISADKGSRLKSFMTSNGFTDVHQALLIDDSSGNIISTTGKGDWVQVIPKAGVAADALSWVEQRASQTFTGGWFNQTSSFNVSTPLEKQTVNLKLAAFDFDKTLAVGSFGDHYLEICGAECVTYTPKGPCPCTSSVQAYGDYFASHFTTPGNNQALNGSDYRGINGVARRDRLLQTFALLESRGVTIRVLSTAWYAVDADMWKYFLVKVFVAAGLDRYLNDSNILTLADPGDSIPADKGSKLKATAESLGFMNIHQSILLDDSATNIASVSGKADWLQVIPKTGLALDALEWLDKRANQDFPVKASSGLSAVPCVFVSLIVAMSF